MNLTQYQDILDQNLAASARRLELGCKWIFQQDNNPMHTSKSTNKWLIDHKINILQCPSQSLDVNPIDKQILPPIFLRFFFLLNKNLSLSNCISIKIILYSKNVEHTIYR
jgi:hypothetical protein